MLLVLTPERWIESWVLEVRAGGGATSLDTRLSVEQRMRDAWASTGVLSTPGLVIDGRVVSAGRIPSAADIAVWLITA